MPAFSLFFPVINSFIPMNLVYPLMALGAGIGTAVQAAVNSRLSAGLGGQPLAEITARLQNDARFMAALDGLRRDGLITTE